MGGGRAATAARTDAEGKTLTLAHNTTKHSTKAGNTISGRIDAIEYIGSAGIAVDCSKLGRAIDRLLLAASKNLPNCCNGN